MTLKLILIRHAKSSWDDPFGDDHSRVLNERGRASAPTMGRWLAQNGHVPDLVLCSDAARTKETLSLMLPEWDAAPQVDYQNRLYHAAPFTLLDALNRSKGDCVAIVAHNPGIGGAANGIVAKRPAHPRFADFPTCAVAVIGFDASSWAEVKPSTGQLLDFAIPADVMG